MNISNPSEKNVFRVSLQNAKIVFNLSSSISCEGLRYEMRFLVAWITIHLRRLTEEELSTWQRTEAFKQSIYFSKEFLRCLSFLHQSGNISTADYLNLEKNYRWIHAQICQWEQRSVARRWLGRFIWLYHGEKMKKGGMKHEKNDRFSFNSCDGLDEFSGVRANSVCD